MPSIAFCNENGGEYVGGKHFETRIEGMAWLKTIAMVIGISWEKRREEKTAERRLSMHVFISGAG